MKDYTTIIAVLLIFIIVMIVFMFRINTEDYDATHPKIEEIKRTIAVIDPMFTKLNIREGKSSYTENKKYITLCLKDEHGKYYDMNTLVYVILHEIAHVKSEKYGHGDEFKHKFAKLLLRAQQLGVYNPAIPMPPVYCGVKSSN